MTSNQKKTCDRLWQIKVTESGVCSFPRCGKPANEGHHVFKRRYLNTRWDISNGMCLCRGHHLLAHNNPFDYEVVVIVEIGIEAYEALRDKSLMIVRHDYKEIKESLK